MEGLKVGLAVYTADNELLGEVKEIQGERFKVDVHFHADFWVNEAVIDAIDQRGVKLNVTKSHLIDVQEGLPRSTMTGNLNR